MHSRILKMIATSGFLTALECTKSVRPGLPARTSWGSLQRSPDPLAGLMGPYFYREGRREGKGQGRGEGRAGKESSNTPHQFLCTSLADEHSKTANATILLQPSVTAKSCQMISGLQRDLQLHSFNISLHKIRHIQTQAFKQLLSLGSLEIKNIKIIIIMR